ncbi:uncharacterized protein LOC128882524 isoform X2 [Hylaeus volcanicus]|uniref:uncharacterized protein LOC128882524 isoform X2 n=1 Tax=Hylaeus volcanicus TaxID=313075 RepID=UPI0023B77DE1|nr:uncharacterized protein LOC128882524 isoform X2 [Hylaeus volcanicus]
MLGYRKEILDKLFKQDMLTIISPGLGLHELVLHFLERYVSSNQSSNETMEANGNVNVTQSSCDTMKLILILNMSPKEEVFFLNLTKTLFNNSFCVRTPDDSAVFESKKKLLGHRHCIYPLSDLTIQRSDIREKFYLKSGIVLMSSRLVVTDILSGRLPRSLINGLIIMNAHNVAQPFLNTLFAVKLIREENQTAFLKAFSDLPEGFNRETSHIDRVLKDLFLQEIHLCHRSDPDVDASLTMPHQPITFQVTPPVTKAMQDIQANIIELIKKGWDALLYRLLEPVWDQLSRRYKQMIQEISLFRKLLASLVELDSISFLQYLESLRMSLALDQRWLLTMEWDTIIKLAKERVYKVNFLEMSTSTKNQSNKIAIFQLETPPKWTAIKQTIREIRDSFTNNGDRNDTIKNGTPCVCRLLVVTREILSFHQLQQVIPNSIEKAKETILKQLLTHHEEQKLPSLEKPSHQNINQHPTSLLNDQQEIPVENAPDGTYTEQTLDTSIDYPIHANESPTIIIPCTDSLLSLHIKVVCFKRDYELYAFLRSFQPDVIILYTPSLPFIRTVEVYSAQLQAPPKDLKKRKIQINEASTESTLTSFKFLQTDTKEEPLKKEEDKINNGKTHSFKIVKVYIYIFCKTAEHQNFLYTVQNERNTWKSLRKQKKFSVITSKELFLKQTNVLCDLLGNYPSTHLSSRKGGIHIPKRQKLDIVEAQPPTVIVDIREFVSALPFHLYSNKFHIVPTTLLIGDYVLSRDICVERKSISDFISSLRSGRLFDQATEMSRNYLFPTLLIEFKSNRTFSFSSQEWSQAFKQTESCFSLKDLLIKFYILLLNIPRVRLLWTCSGFFTASLFHQIKQRREEPDPLKAALLGSNNLLIQKFHNDRFGDVLRRFPGVTSKTAPILSRSISNLSNLAKMELNQLKLILGESSATILYNFLDVKLQSVTDTYG